MQKNVLGLDVGLFHFIHFHHGRTKLFHPFFPRDLLRCVVKADEKEEAKGMREKTF